jgi:hypothetical protein
MDKDNLIDHLSGPISLEPPMFDSIWMPLIAFQVT